jgi:hypothetical protein
VLFYINEVLFVFIKVVPKQSRGSKENKNWPVFFSYYSVKILAVKKASALNTS